MEIALLGFAILLALIGFRVPVPFAMILVGVAGYAYLQGWSGAIAMVGTTAYETGSNYTLSVVPLFVLMGNFVTRAGLSEALYKASYAFLGHRRGGLSMATILACGGFSAVCGSSLATAATMAKVAMPSMREYGYSDSLAAGSIAAGGTLGILIPPSVILVIYGVMTETNIGHLFAAGVIPGALGILGYFGAVKLATWRRPELGPPGPRTPWSERWPKLLDVWGILVLFLLVMGGIYGGLFTPTEAAGIGAAGAFLFAAWKGGLDLRTLYIILVESARTTAMIFMILIGALIFSNFISLSGMPGELSRLVSGYGLAPVFVVLSMLVIYLLLGCVLESLSMILLTVPVFYPVIMALPWGAHVPEAFSLIWFGIVVVVVTEISLITPPIGLNIFVLRSVLPDVATGTVFRGIFPFILADVVRLGLLVGFPWLALYLPSTMG